MRGRIQLSARFQGWPQALEQVALNREATSHSLPHSELSCARCGMFGLA